MILARKYNIITRKLNYYLKMFYFLEYVHYNRTKIDIITVSSV